ncbi:hypothetical protein ACSBR2_004379 [Camellia fascicularis]
MELVGVTSTDMTFSVAFAHLHVVDENTVPSVIVTDRESALMNAICIVFPGTTNLLCRWHIGKNVLANCKKMFETKDKWEMFIMSWNMLVMSSSEKFIFTYKVESSYAKLKRYLGSSQGNFESNWTRIHNLLELQHSEIKSSFEKNKIIVQYDFKPVQFKELRGNVSITALEIILADLPCAHKIANYKRKNRPNPLTSIHSYWTKLDMLSTLHTVSEEWTCTLELELFTKRFKEMDPDVKRFLLQNLRELAKPDCTFFIESEVKSNPRGQQKLKIETSTHHEPSAFELVESAQDSYSPGVIAKAKAFSSELRRYIKYVKDVAADGNCGFRAIAALIGFGEE